MKSKYGFYKVGTANFELSIGDIKGNAQNIIKLIKEAIKEEVRILTFPELSLTSYTSQDLFYHFEFQEEINAQLKEIAKNVSDNILVSVGGPLLYLDKVFSVSYVFFNHKLVGIVGKTFLPNYNEFYEKRWFNSVRDANFNEVKINDEVVPFGNDLIFDLGEVKVAIEICEDLWVINSPSNNYSLNGANCILNLSASNEIIQKSAYRTDLVKMQSAKNYVCYVYSSSGLGESSQDLVFSGQQIIAYDGKVIENKNNYLGLTTAIVDFDVIKAQRLKFKSTFEGDTKSLRFIDLNNSFEFSLLPKTYDGHPFILKDLNKREERAFEIIDLQARGLLTRLKKINCKKVVIGVSGGLDSTLALLVSVEAFKKLNLDLKDIYAVSLPAFGTTSLTFNNAKELINKLGVTYLEINIKDTCLTFLKGLNHDETTYDVTYENVQARTRTEYLMNLANKINGIVVGTGDLSELALGFATYNGDHMSMYGVNSSIPKTLVQDLIRAYIKINPKLEKVLLSILNTPISPELIPSNDNSIKQVTESIIGKYELHDFFLYNFMKNSFSKEKLFELAKIAFKNYSSEYIKKTLDLFFKRFFKNQFKRSCLPDGVKVGSINLSPRGDLRLSSDTSLNNFINKE